ncbi:hypothetical protein AM587_10006110 [Phytophthora nicotianae]|uniref:Uncharacterized protein n=1 Tax=Phytophthora nicotianae TaxID=4792 RepID=A0A0W8DXA7_PHYNI|nr:hypothetical protein AM587_10006110 [Phytophthora nicotianae]
MPNNAPTTADTPDNGGSVVAGNGSSNMAATSDTVGASNSAATPHTIELTPAPVYPSASLQPPPLHHQPGPPVQAMPIAPVQQSLSVLKQQSHQVQQYGHHAHQQYPSSGSLPPPPMQHNATTNQNASLQFYGVGPTVKPSVPAYHFLTPFANEDDSILISIQQAIGKLHRRNGDPYPVEKVKTLLDCHNGLLLLCRPSGKDTVSALLRESADVQARLQQALQRSRQNKCQATITSD